MKKDEVGQSTVEFALTLMMLIGFVLFFFQLAMIFALGNYVHYATFMSARAYLSAGENPDDQRTRAEAVIGQTLKKSELQTGADRFPTFIQGVGGNDLTGMDVNAAQYDENDINFSWLQGVRYSFKGRILMLAFGKTSSTSSQSGANVITLRAESWLGREPSFSECVGEMKSRNSKGLFDNGC